MIQLNITIGGNLQITLDKGRKQNLKEIIEKASNTDLILADLLEVSHYTGNDWYTIEGVLTEMPLIAFGSICEEEEDFPRDYEKVWGFMNYELESFAETLLTDKRVIFKRV